MTHHQHDDDTAKRVRRASAGEPQAGPRAEEAEPGREPGDRATSNREDTPEEVRDEDRRAATDRVERMQQEGKGMGGTPTDGRADQVDEDAIERAARDEE